jgi:putative ABC transport system permease protein
VNWWKRLLGSERLERELERELQYHFDRQLEVNRRGGMSDEEARRMTRLQFGGLDQVKEQCRDARGTRWVHDLAADLRFAVRLLAKEPVLTAVAVLALALGIGVNNTFFTVINAVCFRGLPIDDPDRVLYVAARDAEQRDLGVSYKDFDDMRTGTRAFAGLAAFVTAPVTLGDEERAPDRVSGAYVSANAFQLLREDAALGRTFRVDEDRAGAPRVVILGDRFWRARYGADTRLLGQTVRVDGVPAIVIGIMRAGFRFPLNADLWLPLAFAPGLMDAARDARSLSMFGRLADGAAASQADAELNAVARTLGQEFPETNRGIRTTLVPINERYNGRITDPVWLAFMMAGLLVLLIACANVSNLLLMRAVHRSREIAIRVTMGATRLRVVRQLLAESTVLAALGGSLGLGLSVLGARLLSVSLTEDAPYWVHFTMDARGFVALAAVCFTSVFVFGLVPALHVSRTRLNEVLQEGGRGGAGSVRARRLTAMFLTAEFALTVVLLAAVAMSFRSFVAARSADLVINPSQLLTMWVSLPAERYRTPDQLAAFYERLEERLGGIGVVSSAALADALPFAGATARAVGVEGRPTASEATAPTVSLVAIGEAYFETLRTPVLAGRPFTGRDGVAGQHTAIVNQRFAATHFPGQDPIGRRIRLSAAGAESGWLTIVGVCPSIRQRARGIEPDPVVYVPLRQAPAATVAVMLRHSTDAASLAAVMRQEFRSLDPELAVYRVMTMDAVIGAVTLNGRVSQALITIIACIALGLSMVGLHAVTAHAVAQRTREIGIRTALGARPRQLVAMVLVSALRRLVLGLLVGIGCTVVWERLLGDPTQRYRMTDPAVLGMVTVLVVAVALIACIWPARRASSLEPVMALRCE